jgi:hypothetical protein
MENNIVEIWRQLLAGVPRNLWFAISTTSSYKYNLQAATSLNLVEYETILLASSIMVKKGDTVVYSYSKLEYLLGALRGRLTVHINRSKIDRNGTPLYFIAVERPTFRNPSAQAKADLRVLPNRRGNGLDEGRLRLLERLCTERATADEPELIVEEQLPLPPQILEQEQPEYELPQEEEQHRRSSRRRRVLQDLQLQPSPERRTRTRGGRQEYTAGGEPDLIVDEQLSPTPQVEEQGRQHHRAIVKLLGSKRSLLCN